MSRFLLQARHRVPAISGALAVAGNIQAIAEAGLQFPGNGTANSDIRLLWNGANLLSRTAQTVIWKIRYDAQAGYYAVTWSAYNDGTFHFDQYEFGGHPYPCDGAFDGNGNATGATGGSGTVHYMELAGIPGGQDGIALPINPAFLIVKDGRWLTQARTCEVISGTTLRHKVYPDIENAPSDYIQREVLLSSLPSPSAPAFYFGASDWRTNQPSSGRNDECPSGVLRGMKLFNAALSASDIATEAASETNTPQTAAGIASVWYMNINPTPTDVTDKSGAGHDPTWANANRPTAWTP